MSGASNETVHTNLDKQHRNETVANRSRNPDISKVIIIHKYKNQIPINHSILC